MEDEKKVAVIGDNKLETLKAIQEELKNGEFETVTAKQLLDEVENVKGSIENPLVFEKSPDDDIIPEKTNPFDKLSTKKKRSMYKKLMKRIKRNGKSLYSIETANQMKEQRKVLKEKRYTERRKRMDEGNKKANEKR